MDATWGWQHADFYPDERREQGPVTEAQAAYADFPWQAQLDQLKERSREDLTSVPPGVWFRRGPETLTLTMVDEWRVLADYEVGEEAYCCELSLSWWAHTLAPEDLIQMFFAGTLPQWPGWHPAGPSTSQKPGAAGELVQFVSRSRASGWVWAPLAGIGALGMLGVLILVFSGQPWWAVLVLLGMPLLMFGSRASLQWQYARVSEGQQVTIYPAAHRLRVQDRWGVLEFDREQVRECKVVRGRADKHFDRQYAHIVFWLKNRQVCVITHETGPPEEIARLLGLHYHLQEDYTPSIHYRRLSEQELAAAEQDHQRRVVEFRARFQEYSSAQLESIVHSPERYASHAVAAAEQLLQSRTTTNS